MFKFRRWWLLCGAVLVGVVALNGVVNGVVDAKAAPAPRAVCVRGGATATDGVSGRGLVCVQTKARGLRWRFQPTTVTTTTTSPTTTTVSGVVAPVLVSVSANDGVRVTVAGMRPDTGVYSLQWVLQGSTFNTYQMARATSPSMNVPAGWFACNRTYTFRVFVMQADWQLADGHQTQNVTPHSTPFDVVMPACTAPAPAAAVTCATGGACAVGDTGPGGGVVFYVASSNFTSTGSDCNTTCKYLEAAPTGWGNGITFAAGETTGTPLVDPLLKWCSDTTTLRNATTKTAIGDGRPNTTTGVTCTTGAIFHAELYAGNGKTDWHLPSKDELNELCKYAKNTGQPVGGATRCTGGSAATLRGFSTDVYWSSSDSADGVAGANALIQDFFDGSQTISLKGSPSYVRPVRAFGGTVACADGGACVVGDTGPGGGIVFYVSASNFTSTGSACNTTCKYLEAAPTNWLTDTIGDPRRSWVTNVLSNRSSLVVGADGTAIGSGYQNSLDIVAQTGNVADSSAAVLARAYQGNSKTDWYLPSKDELNELCKYAKNTGQAVGGATRCTGGSDASLRGFTADGYWSSSEIDSTKALGQLFSGGDHGNVTKDNTLLMRPVRAFG